MSSFLKNVFMIVGIMLIALLLFNLTFGARGRSIMWNGIRPAIEKSWKDYTLDDGKKIEDALTDEFNRVNDLSVR